VPATPRNELDAPLGRIREFRKLTPLQKLLRLEEMHRFIDIATPAKAKRIREKLRRAR
jgi:hypothetical protein